MRWIWTSAQKNMFLFTQQTQHPDRYNNEFWHNWLPIFVGHNWISEHKYNVKICCLPIVGKSPSQTNNKTNLNPNDSRSTKWSQRTSFSLIFLTFQNYCHIFFFIGVCDAFNLYYIHKYCYRMIRESVERIDEHNRQKKSNQKCDWPLSRTSTKSKCLQNVVISQTSNCMFSVRYMDTSIRVYASGALHTCTGSVVGERCVSVCMCVCVTSRTRKLDEQVRGKSNGRMQWKSQRAETTKTPQTRERRGAGEKEILIDLVFVLFGLESQLKELKLSASIALVGVLLFCLFVMLLSYMSLSMIFDVWRIPL